MSNKENKIKKLEQESHRRELVKRTKMLGMEIEKIERNRVSKDIDSIQNRIKSLNALIVGFVKAEVEKVKNDSQLLVMPESDYKLVYKSYIETYSSIREDVCFTIEKKEKNFREKFNKIFPEIDFLDERPIIMVLNSLYDIIEQLNQIHIFLNRYN